MRVIASPTSGKRTAGIVGAKHAADSSSSTGRVRKRPPAARAKQRKALSHADLPAFLGNIATLLNSGVPLTKALEALAMDETFKKAAPIMETLVGDIRSGSSFSAALAKHPDSFSPMVISLVRAGEVGGTLAPALQRLADNIEKRREMIAQIRQALTYPTIVTVLGAAAVGFLMLFVIPVFEETYSKAGMPLPSITLTLIAISRFVAATWWIGLLAALGGVSAYWHYRNHARVRMVKDRLLLRIPLLGSLICSVMVSRFVQTFGSLLAAGVSIKESLALTERVVNHSQFARMVRDLRLAVSRGEGLGEKLREHRTLFPPLLTQMMILGEKSGDLGTMMNQIGQYIQKDLRRRTQQLSSLIEPIVTVAMAFMIGTIALAIYLPMFDMFKQVK